MAKNENKPFADHLYLPVASGTLSGDPVISGAFAGLAETDRDSSGYSTVKLTGTINISVKGINGSGNIAVAIGDLLYYTTGDTPPVSKKATGTLFGKAVGVVTTGTTATIEVALSN